MRSRACAVFVALASGMTAFAVQDAQDPDRPPRQRGEGMGMMGMMRDCMEHCRAAHEQASGLRETVAEARASGDPERMRAALKEVEGHLSETTDRMSDCMRMMGDRRAGERMMRDGMMGGRDREPVARGTRDTAAETFSGEIVRLVRVPSRRGVGTGLHLYVETDDETLPVHVGPSGYAEEREIEFQAGDRVDVTGVRWDVDGEAVVIASEIRRGERTLRLRDSFGRPLWSGRVRRSED